MEIYISEEGKQARMCASFFFSFFFKGYHLLVEGRASSPPICFCFKYINQSLGNSEGIVKVGIICTAVSPASVVRIMT